MRALALIGLVILLMGCATRPVVPKVVRVQVPTYVALPASLTADCDVYRAKGQTVGEAVVAANKRLAALNTCNERLKAIRNLQP